MWFQKWHEELGELSCSAQKSEKMHIGGLFLSKGYLFQLENFSGIMCHDSER